MWKGIYAVLIVTGALAAPASASAHIYPATVFPNERVIQDSRLDLMRAAALEYWAQRGVTGCAGGITISVATLHGMPGYESDVVAGFAESDIDHPACRVILNRNTTVRALAATGPVRRRAQVSWRRDRVRNLIRSIFHEVGHTLGQALPVWDGAQWLDAHPESGVMSHDATAPIECWRLAVRLVWRAYHRPRGDR